MEHDFPFSLLLSGNVFVLGKNRPLLGTISADSFLLFFFEDKLFFPFLFGASIFLVGKLFFPGFGVGIFLS